MRHRFAEMTRRDALEKVLAGLKAAVEAGLTPVKINVVVIGGTNDDEVVAFAGWARETGYEVRFIEYMPLDAEHEWEREKVVPAADILETIDAVYPSRATSHGAEPATSYGFADGAPGGIGVIADRDAALLRHLQPPAPDGRGPDAFVPLRARGNRPPRSDARWRLRRGAGRIDPRRRLAQVVGAPHQPPDFVQPERSMSMIGG